jgi:hypothetical protein
VQKSASAISFFNIESEINILVTCSASITRVYVSDKCIGDLPLLHLLTLMMEAEEVSESETLFLLPNFDMADHPRKF